MASMKETIIAKIEERPGVDRAFVKANLPKIAKCIFDGFLAGQKEPAIISAIVKKFKL